MVKAIDSSSIGRFVLAGSNPVESNSHHVRVVKEIDLSSIGSKSAQVRTLLVTPFRFIGLMVRRVCYEIRVQISCEPNI